MTFAKLHVTLPNFKSAALRAEGATAKHVDHNSSTDNIERALNESQPASAHAHVPTIGSDAKPRAVVNRNETCRTACQSSQVLSPAMR